MTDARQPAISHSEKTLYVNIRELIVAARRSVARGVDLAQVWTNFEIGRHIVEHEQQGEVRADYGKEVVKNLARRLMNEFGNGFSERNLAYMRTFYLLYQKRMPILQTPSAISSADKKLQTSSAKSPPF